MNKNIFCFVVFAISFLSSCGSYANKVTLFEYTSTEFEVEITENDEVANIDFQNVSFPISLIHFKKYERTFIKVNDDNWFLIELNWKFDDDSTPKMDEVLLFKNKNDYVILFPTYTEEFPTLGLIGISQNGVFKDLGVHTYNYSDYNRAKGKTVNGNYVLDEINDTIRVLLQSTPDIMLSDLEYRDNTSESISDKEKAMIQLLFSKTINSHVNTNETTVLYEYMFDLNKDQVLDKINVLQKNENIDGFDSQHFGLTLEIFKGERDRLINWKENNCIFNSQNNCISEGFDRITLKEGSFTIVQQTCYDYSTLVDSYTTFSVIDDEIYLEEYREEYFNKRNHQQKIPTKTWTEVDFGRVKFENVSKNFLLNLRK